jgi:hypothetical protein
MKAIFRYFKMTSKRVLVGMMVLLGLFHISRVLIEFQHIRLEVEQSAIRVASEIELANQSKDLFSLRKILRDIKSDGVEWLSFEGSISKELESGPLQIGDSQSIGFLNRSFKFPVDYRGSTIGTLKFGIIPGKSAVVCLSTMFSIIWEFQFSCLPLSDWFSLKYSKPFYELKATLRL